jgi:pre-mRNA-splicing factor ISY1
MMDLEGKKVDVLDTTDKGLSYRYFGAVKFLPDIKELFNNPPKGKNTRSRYDIYKRIDTSYYGYRNDVDSILEKVERLTKEEMQARALREWHMIESMH